MDRFYLEKRLSWRGRSCPSKNILSLLDTTDHGLAQTHIPFSSPCEIGDTREYGI
jgi:hypothetical protein